MTQTFTFIAHGEMIGYIAAGLVLLTFTARSMVSLRLLALCSNVMFIVYAAMSGLMPILALHIFLIPINLMRLREISKSKQCATLVRVAPRDSEAPPAGGASSG